MFFNKGKEIITVLLLESIWRRAQDSNLQPLRATVFKTASSPPGHTAYGVEGGIRTLAHRSA